MRRIRLAQFSIFVSAILCLFLSSIYGQQSGTAGKKKEFLFHGKVEKVDAKEKTITVSNEKIEGWMDSMSMTYAVDKVEVLSKVKAGDQITAKVYDGDYKVLHEVQVTPPAKAPATPAKK